MTGLLPKDTTPALAGGGVMPAVAGFESARSANKVLEKDASIDTSELVTKEYLDMKFAHHESRQWTKILALHITMAGVIIAAFRFFGG